MVSRLMCHQQGGNGFDRERSDHGEIVVALIDRPRGQSFCETIVSTALQWLDIT